MDDLIEKIERAFADVEYPGDDDLTDSTVGEEPAALKIEFRGKSDRSKLDADFLNHAPDGWGTAISFFSGNALRFYLPLYLIADIRDQLRGPNDPGVRLCAGLTPSGETERISKMFGGGTMGESARETFDQFDPEQVSAVVAYLRWKLEAGAASNREIEQALENYWLKRETDSRK
jgi:hypothetical protein